MSNTQPVILIAEDDMFLNDILVKRFSREGFDVEVVRDGATAIRWMKNRSPDIFLLDIGLPEMNGYQVLEHMKSDPDLSNILTVIVTNYDSDADRERIASYEPRLHILKADVSIINIIEMVEKAYKESSAK